MNLIFQEPIKCKICEETNPLLLQTHHWSYEPEITDTLCKKCHILQHKSKHGVGNGLIKKRDIFVLKILLEKIGEEIRFSDVRKYYFVSPFPRFLKTKLIRKTDFFPIYKINKEYVNQIFEKITSKEEKIILK